MKNNCVVEYGSNIEPDLNVPIAIELIKHSHILIKQSSLLITKPIMHKNNPNFHNGALLIETTLAREEFNQFLKNVEIKIGRIKTTDKYAARTIDLDIIVWNGDIINDDFYTREFVKKSVLEILPNIKY